MSLADINQQMTIYVGFFIIVLGLLGNGLNVFIFSSVRVYRTTPCSFYFLVGSIGNMLYLLINVTTRIISVGYGWDLAGIAVVWCKVRTFCLITISLIIFSCSCLATIDQYLVTSQRPHLRHGSQLKWAHRLVLAVIVFWCLHSVPILVFYTIPLESSRCMCVNSAYAIYISVCILVLITAVPVMTMTTFGYLAYQNIQRTIVLAVLRADRQLTKMTLIQVVLAVICITPYGVYTAYVLITAGVVKDANRLAHETLFATAFSLIAYFYYAVC
jgi:hypothetical protein